MPYGHSPSYRRKDGIGSDGQYSNSVGVCQNQDFHISQRNLVSRLPPRLLQVYKRAEVCEVCLRKLECREPRRCVFCFLNETPFSIIFRSSKRPVSAEIGVACGPTNFMPLYSGIVGYRDDNAAVCLVMCHSEIEHIG